ncbi:hypothetical protein Gorai_021825 [Gossypium raimondii]|uniref:RNase H type-1 domain-containing protein n=1 Tax=Gossypium raimondii TaxID=29730 RepID=A0A7J8NRQ2_GOSRA|nr:hypothetical protein [Gossypium raimondii]
MLPLTSSPLIGTVGTIEIIFFRGKEEEAKVVWERAATLCHDFHIHNLLNKPLLPVITADKKWTKPPYGIVKINFDATVLMKKMGYGMLARDSDGFVLGEGAGIIDTNMQIEWVELKAFEESLNFARSLNFPNLVFETNCISLVNRINKRGQNITLLGHRINDVCKLPEYFNLPKIMWANRSCNRIANHLCKMAMDKNCNFNFNLDYPMDIHELVMNDSIN